MGWGCMSKNGVGPLYQTSAVISGKSYVEILDNVLRPKLYGSVMIFSVITTSEVPVA